MPDFLAEELGNSRFGSPCINTLTVYQSWVPGLENCQHVVGGIEGGRHSGVGKQSAAVIAPSWDFNIQKTGLKPKNQNRKKW